MVAKHRSATTNDTICLAVVLLEIDSFLPPGLDTQILLRIADVGSLLEQSESICTKVAEAHLEAQPRSCAWYGRRIRQAVQRYTDLSDRCCQGSNEQYHGFDGLWCWSYNSTTTVTTEASAISINLDSTVRQILRSSECRYAASLTY